MKTAEDGVAGEDWIWTVEGEAETEIKVKGSRFISRVASVETGEDAEGIVRAVSKKYHDATHVCFTYRTGWGDAARFRHSDAGEPAGTAGKPILDAMDRRLIGFVVCTVVRYFGGVKLGTGGLSRAYGRSAAAALDKAVKVKIWNTITNEVVFPYEWTGVVRSLLSRYRCTIDETVFQEQTRILFTVPKYLSGKLKQELLDATAGKVKVQFIQSVSGTEGTDIWPNASIIKKT